MSRQSTFHRSRAGRSGSGSHRSSGAAKRHASAGRGSSSSPPASFRQSEPYTRCLVTASTPKPEGGARCVSSARRDLYGGRLATAVPTVTLAFRENLWNLMASPNVILLSIVLSSDVHDSMGACNENHCCGLLRAARLKERHSQM